MNGWNGKSLWVDLGTGRLETREIDPGTLRAFIGGRGLNDRILFDLVAPGIDPLGPENALAFGVGPFTGTPLSSTSRVQVSTLSPLSGILGDGNAGGSFGLSMKRSGYDQFVFTGASERPLVLIVDGLEARLVEASDLVQTSTWEKTDLLRQRYGNDFSVAAIGQAGENLVRFASVIFDRHNSAARGSGAVMGSKNLLAVAVRGSLDTSLASPGEFRALADTDRDFLKNDPFQRDTIARIGSHIGMIRWFPGFRNNERYLGPDEVPAQFLPEALKAYEVGRTACAGCVVPCKDIFRIPSGTYAGEIGKAMEHECLHCLGTNCGVTDPVAVMTMENLADKYGMCVIGLGNVVALAKDLFAHGVIGIKETEGLDLSWENAEAQIELIHRVALRQGIGNLVAEGLMNFARIVGGKAMDFCYHVKGLSRGPHPAGIFALAHATSTRGADHLRGRSWAFGENDPEIWPKLIRQGFIREEDPVNTLFISERAVTLTDMVGRCKGSVNNWASAVPLVSTHPMLKGEALLLEAATGIPYSEEELEAASDRVYLLEMAFNARQGVRRKDDRFPVRWDLIGSEWAAHEAAKHEAMLDVYYLLRGCDPETGIPKPETLRKLGLGFAAEALETSPGKGEWEGPPLRDPAAYPKGSRRA